MAIEKNYKFKNNVFATQVLGTGVIGLGKVQEKTTFVPPVGAGAGIRLTSTYGHGRVGQRNFHEAKKVPVRSTSPDSPLAKSVSFSTRNGFLLGSVISGSRRPLLLDIKCGRARIGGSTVAEITLRDKPDFLLKNYMLVQVAYGEKTVFTGYTRLADSELDEIKGVYRVKAHGLVKQLEDIADDTTIVGIQDLGQIVHDRFLLHVNDTDIGYNATKINVLTGTTSSGDIEPGSQNLAKFFETCAVGSKHKWGVDAEGDFYFLPLTQDAVTKRVFFVGYEVNEFQPEYNQEYIINSIDVRRQSGKGSGGAGWVIGANGKNLKSIGNHGVKHKSVTVAGFFEDAFCEVVKDNILEERGDPALTAKIKNIPLRNDLDILEDGTYAFIQRPKTYRTEIQDCEEISDFSYVGTGDLVASIETASNLIVSGGGALRLEYTNAVDDMIFFNTFANGFIRRIIFHVNSQAQGAGILEACAGRFLVDEESQPLDIGLVNDYDELSFDLTGTELREINIIGIKIKDTSGTPNIILIDQIEVETHGHQRYEIQLDAIDFHFSERGDFIDNLELGPQPVVTEDRIAAIKELAETNDSTLEVR